MGNSLLGKATTIYLRAFGSPLCTTSSVAGSWDLCAFKQAPQKAVRSQTAGLGPHY